jgi:Ring finger domain
MSNSCCPICLEAIWAPNYTVGTCVPCGHCIHVECYDSWKARGSNLESTKCPTCNTPSSTFCRLYVDLPRLNHGNDAASDNTKVDTGNIDLRWVLRNAEDQITKLCEAKIKQIENLPSQLKRKIREFRTEIISQRQTLQFDSLPVLQRELPLVVMELLNLVTMSFENNSIG